MSPDARLRAYDGLRALELPSTLSSGYAQPCLRCSSTNGGTSFGSRALQDVVSGPRRDPDMTPSCTLARNRKAAEKAEKPARKSKKDPNAPKRALSAYMFFSQDWRERIKAENPDAGFGEVGKLLGAKWKELDDSEKKPYIEKAARDKERADEAKASYDSKKQSGSGEDEDDEE
ncbi:hypothetical protein CPC08DRAFT_819299 [Agrocybe pediades]|nr:hypothetical protein CPC08DRAFT_819299 [Agrocybe pediades]